MAKGLPFEDEAAREHIWLRGFLMGPTGSGKSRGALELASQLFDGALKVTLVNTEQGRGKLYADRYKYGLIDLSADGVGPDEVDYSPETWIEALDMCETRNPGGVYVLDSVTHEWAGRNGILQMADRFGDWKEVRPRHEQFIARIAACQAHVIVCCRAKMKYEVTEEEVPGRTRPRQVVTALGVGPIQDSELQYHFNLVGTFDQRSHDVVWSGHVDPLVDQVANLAGDGPAVAAELSKWLSEGAPPEEPPMASEDAVAEMFKLWGEERDDWEEASGPVLAKARRQNRGELHPDWVAEQIEKSKQRLARRRPAAEPAT